MLNMDAKKYFQQGASTGMHQTIPYCSHCLYNIWLILLLLQLINTVFATIVLSLLQLKYRERYYKSEQNKK